MTPRLIPAYGRSLAAAGSDRALDGIRRRLAVLQEQSATGLRVNRPSDDPAAFAQARELDALDARYGSYLDAIGAARLWVDQTASALGTLEGIAGRAHELGLQGANDTLSAEERAALADEVDGLLDELVDALNTRAGDEYVFAGNNTLQAPFADDGTPTSTALDGQRVRRVGPTTELAINVTGDAVQDVGGFTAAEALGDLAAALRGEGAFSITEATGRVEETLDHFIGLSGANGVVGNRLTDAEIQTSNASIALQARRSDLEDADYLRVATDLQQAQLQLEAALSTTAMLEQTTLLDYLR